MHENREISSTSWSKDQDRSAKAINQTADVNVQEKSDCAVVPLNRPNKEGQASAEVGEGRAQTGENIVRSHMPPTQSGTRMSQGLDGVRQAASVRKQERFTALLHHVTLNLLRDSFYALKRQASPGVDGVTWQEYGRDLEARLSDLHGRIHRGAQGSAGDVGHIQVVEDSSVICRCGNVGCLEALAGGGAIGRDGLAAALEGRSDRLRAALDQHGGVTAADVARAASFGDPVSVALLQSAGRRVGLMLASVVNLFNPSLVVVGGGVAQSGDQLLAAIRETVYRRSLPLATRELVLRRSSLGALAGVMGASSMVVEQLFSREAMARLVTLGGPDPALEEAVAGIG